jgi:hypothetical protein
MSLKPKVAHSLFSYPREKGSSLLAGRQAFFPKQIAI